MNSSAIRSKLVSGLVSSAGVNTSEAKQIVNCLIGKMNAAGIKTNGEAQSHQNQVTQFTTTCARQAVAATG